MAYSKLFSKLRGRAFDNIKLNVVLFAQYPDFKIEFDLDQALGTYSTQQNQWK
ncbi:hypothetical protein [Psychroflexus tropicus]|uniref:hypothetical protein n=1 Tax=Psychroflexus tropicus TaxID=197345 RepID=UPI00036E4555|nr:hypothetical protein [Psychroflexus tropicus]